MNILTNAILACAPGGRVGPVHPARRRRGAHHDRRQRPRRAGRVGRALFDPFFTTRPVGEGTGLGLSIALTVVTAHKGRIAVDNASGGGAASPSTFPSNRQIRHDRRSREPGFRRRSFGERDVDCQVRGEVSGSAGPAPLCPGRRRRARDHGVGRRSARTRLRGDHGQLHRRGPLSTESQVRGGDPHRPAYARWNRSRAPGVRLWPWPPNATRILFTGYSDISAVIEAVERGTGLPLPDQAVAARGAQGGHRPGRRALPDGPREPPPA